VDASFFKRFERCRLRVRQSWFNTSLGKCPAPASRLYQQEFNLALPYSITDCGHLLALAHPARLREPEKLYRLLRSSPVVPSRTVLDIRNSHL
jgi:hypothetical protein